MRALFIAVVEILLAIVTVAVVTFLIMCAVGYAGVLRHRYGTPATIASVVLAILWLPLLKLGARSARRRREQRAEPQLAPDAARDPMMRQNRGDYYAQAGQYERALAEYLWCFDHGQEADPAYVGVRLSFLLSSIAELRKPYPPAERALVERRDRAEAALFGPAGKPLHAMEVAAINRVLGDVDRTVATADRLDAKGAAGAPLRQALLHEIIDRLLETRRYADILRMSGPPHAHVENAIESFRFTQNEVATLGDVPMPANVDPEQVAGILAEHRPELLRHDREQVATTAGKFVEALLGTGRRDEAQRIADQALDFDPSPETLAVLVRHARRAGDAETADAWEGRRLKRTDD